PTAAAATVAPARAAAAAGTGARAARAAARSATARVVDDFADIGRTVDHDVRNRRANRPRPEGGANREGHDHCAGARGLAVFAFRVLQAARGLHARVGASGIELSE